NSGLVVNAATGAAFLYLKGHASSLLQNGLRLVLVTFLLTSALWAQTDFITTLISVNSTTGCQVTIVFAAIFDQLARTCLQQAIIWAIDHHERVSKAESLIAQGAIFLRLVLGAVFVGLQRPQLDIICITTTSVLSFGVALLGADLAFSVAILGRAISFGLIKDIQEGTATSSRSKAALLTIVGLLIWTGTSAPLMLGIRSTNVMTRTAIPGTGLSILIAILTLFKDSLAPTKEEPDSLSDAGTLRDPHPTRHLQSRDISTSDSTLPPSRYEELKDDALASFRAASQLQPSHLRTGSNGTVTKLPVISRPNVGQAITGIGGVPVQGAFFPPLRAQTMPVSMEAKAPNNRPAVLTRKGTKLTISNPILTEDSELKVMAKIPTIDLATAVENEKQRAKAGQMVEPPASFTSRMELRPPPIPAKAVKRKSLAFGGDAANTPAPGEVTEASARPGEKSTATTSATMLSPGVEELRRRSPRQTPDVAQLSNTVASGRPQTGGSSRKQQQSQFPARASSLHQNRMTSLAKPLPSAPFPPPFPAPFPPSAVNFSFPVDSQQPVPPLRNQSVNTGLPPRRGPGSMSPENGSSKSSPADTHPRPGLPSNPRASRMRTLGKERAVAQDQTVMFMKGIEYSNPAAVQRAVDSAKEKQSIKSPGRTASMVHRPRPIPRLPSIDRAIFPAEGSPNMHEHKRSLSNGPSRTKTLLMFPAVPNSGKLIPLPLLPKSAGILLRSQDDAKSMTWDEKMDMFYPESGSARSSIVGNMRRRSRSVPDVPMMPMVLSENRRDTASPHNSMYQTDGSARTSVATQSISNLLEDFPRPQESVSSKSNGYQSANRGLKSNASKSPTHQPSTRNAADRRSSPILPAEDLSMFSPYSEARSIVDDGSTNWGSIHSPGTFVNVQQARAVDVPAVPKLPQGGAGFAVGPVPQPVRDEAMGTSTVTTESSVDHVADFTPEVVPAEEAQAIAETEQGWHRRVGEECPTFSDRGQIPRQRRIPPPAPLLLRRTNMVPMAVQAEPSPLESPEHALAMIQEQLRKLDDLDRGSASGGQRDRMTLLANLETELGQQEHQWQGLRGTLMVRDSQSTLGGTPKFDSLHVGGRRSFATPQREDSLQPASFTKQVSRQLLSEQAVDNTGHPSSQATYPTHSDISQQALARDQTAYVGTRAHLPSRAADNNGGLQVAGLRESVFSLSKNAPQGTDGAGSEYDRESRVVHTNPGKTLWCPISSDAAASGASLWTPATEPAVREIVPGQIATDVVRRRLDKDLEPLVIESTSLWEKSMSERRFSQHGLWRSATRPPAMEPVKEQQQVNRQTAQRPPRKSKRITMLPDIMESPKPLDRRGTMGIFQFPWGEMSDMPSVPTRPLTMMAMAGTMTTGQGREQPGADNWNAGSRSFFEDYEAEEDGDSDYGSFSESDDEDDDDGFDETVLWEIASLLKPSQERSQERSGNSVLSPTRGAPHQAPQRGEEGATGFHPDKQADGAEFVRRNDPEAMRFITTNFASSETKSPSTPVKSRSSAANPVPERLPLITCWSDGHVVVPPSAPILRPSKGLSQPDNAIWNSYLPIDNAARVQARKAELSTLQSTTLWTQAPPKKATEPSLDGLWSPAVPQGLSVAPSAMWELPPVIEPVSYGLAHPDAELWTKYLPAHDESPRVKPREAQPATITSQAMWTKPSAAVLVAHSAGPLWTAPKSTNSSSSTPTKAVSFGLWAPAPAAAEVKEPMGLFSLSHQRSDFRTSSLSPAALDMARKPRAPEQPFPDFGFTHLWNQAPLWDAAATKAAVKMQREIDELVLEGLFSLNHRRTNFRTTSEAPAALDTKSKARILQEPLPKLTSDSLWSVRDQPPAPVALDWLAISSSKPRAASLASSTASSQDSEFLFMGAASSSTVASSVASSVSFDDAATKPARRMEATPAQWLAALETAISASKGTATLDSRDQALDSAESPSSAYQLWSKRDDDMADYAVDDNSMWQPSSSPTNRYLMLTPTPGALDDAQLRASAETLRRNGKINARPPPPVFHGSSVSAFTAGVSDTPRDFSAQALWTSDPAAAAAATAGATIEEERAWLDKSLRQTMSLVHLW
ncbi:hypothetical protein B0J13DRAFT_658004, partial [Dactylonectria estremocensis]